MNFKTVKSFILHVQEQLDNNKLVLPTLPDVALKVIDLASKENVSFQELSDIIATDAVISIRLIQVANSPLYAGINKIESINLAVSRLGINTVKVLVTAIVMQQMFVPTTEILNSYFQKIWEDSVQISAICRSLTSFAPHLNAEEAMLAGLIHQIGKLPILSIVEDSPEFVSDPKRLGLLLDKSHTIVGEMMMSAWDFPDKFKNVVAHYTDFTRDSGEIADYVDIVQVAFLQVNIQKKSNSDWSKIPAFSKLGLNPDVGVFELDDLAYEIMEATNMLKNIN